MRKLKLQMQLSVDGFVGGPNGELDWMTWNWDDKLKEHVLKMHDNVDTILLGRKMIPDFVTTWEKLDADPKTADEFSSKMVNTEKIVFSKTLKELDPEWKNIRLEHGDLKEVITELKRKEGNDIIVYGGANFVSNLILAGLIDELNLFVNPVAIGKGLEIFTGDTKLELVDAQSFPCGVVKLEYKPK